MTLRRAHAGDAAKLALIGGASFLETFANDHPGDALVAFVRDHHGIAAWDATLADPQNAVWIAEECAGSPIGYAVLASARLPGTTARDAEIKRIYLLSKWHGSGLGAALFAAAETEARARAALRLVLSVYTRNARAIRFYESRGFTRIGQAAFAEFPAEFDDYVMAKPLV
ncbi:MAG: N-acetyltransferase family protein [Sphingomonadaceae bacterium]